MVIRLFSLLELFNNKMAKEEMFIIWYFVEKRFKIEKIEN